MDKKLLNHGRGGAAPSPEKKKIQNAPLTSSFNAENNIEAPVIKLDGIPKVETVEERIFRIAGIQIHITNRAKIRTHIEKVQALKFGELDEKDCIILAPAAGEQYPIKSPELCKLIKETVKNYLGDRLIETEAQIVF